MKKVVVNLSSNISSFEFIYLLNGHYRYFTLKTCLITMISNIHLFIIRNIQLMSNFKTIAFETLKKFI